jgi:hypothetical protein
MAFVVGSTVPSSECEELTYLRRLLSFLNLLFVPMIVDSSEELVIAGDDPLDDCFPEESFHRSNHGSEETETLDRESEAQERDFTFHSRDYMPLPEVSDIEYKPSDSECSTLQFSENIEELSSPSKKVVNQIDDKWGGITAERMKIKIPNSTPVKRLRDMRSPGLMLSPVDSTHSVERKLKIATPGDQFSEGISYYYNPCYSASRISPLKPQSKFTSVTRPKADCAEVMEDYLTIDGRISPKSRYSEKIRMEESHFASYRPVVERVV